MTTLYFGAQQFDPTQVLGYTSSRDSRNVLHDILGRQDDDVTLRPAGLRNGTLELGFQGITSEADSLALVNAASTIGVGVLTDGARATVGMSFVVNGSIARDLDDESRDAWVVRIPYREVLPT